MHAGAESGLMFFPLLQSFCTDKELSTHHHLHHHHHHLNTTTDHGNHMGNLFRTSNITEYDMGGEGDLFKAPKPIIEEPELAFNPMSAVMTVISNEGDIVSETMKAADMETIQNEHMNDVFYECKKDLLEKCVINESVSEPHVDDKVPVMQTDEVPVPGKIMLKSSSSGCLNSMDWISGFNFDGMDFETAFGLKRAYSEGDIQALRTSNTNRGEANSAHASFEKQLIISELKAEERQQKLTRYRKKKSKRNFGRTIKYACRKALADSQPRVRGRFVKTEEFDVSKPFD